MNPRSMRILHIFRAPLGGLFRHVLDLSRAQAARGHAVGFLCDADTAANARSRRSRSSAPPSPSG
jgi:hypothetical protein